MQVLSPGHFLCFVGPGPVPGPLPLQPSREAGGPGRHSDSRHTMWRLPAWVSHGVGLEDSWLADQDFGSWGPSLTPPPPEQASVFPSAKWDGSEPVNVPGRSLS